MNIRFVILSHVSLSLFSFLNIFSLFFRLDRSKDAITVFIFFHLWVGLGLVDLPSSLKHLTQFPESLLPTRPPVSPIFLLPPWPLLPSLHFLPSSFAAPSTHPCISLLMSHSPLPQPPRGTPSLLVWRPPDLSNSACPQCHTR